MRVEDGFVSLVGATEWQCQRDEAELVTANIVGVIGVRSEIALTGALPDGADVKRAIENAFKRDARLDAEDLTVEAANGTIILKGVVGSWSEHDAAIAAAWAAPGVTEPVDGVPGDGRKVRQGLRRRLPPLRVTAHPAPYTTCRGMKRSARIARHSNARRR